MAYRLMHWLEYHISTFADCADELSQQLTELGAVAITFQDAGDHPIFEPQPDTTLLWPKTRVIGLFEDTAKSQNVISFLENQQALGQVIQFHLKHLADEDWERRCLEGFEPLSFGKRLWICPSWKTPPDPQAVNIILDPGLAFGTGTHPTTRLCLEWLEKHIINQDLLIDYGCGSGILAIAALKLGVQRAIAIDNDPEALEATKTNAIRNNLRTATGEAAHNSMELLIQSPGFILPKTPLLIANILANPLIQLASYFSSRVNPQGQVILSGILPDQVEDVSKAYSPWFKIEKPLFFEGWALIEGIRKKLVSDKNLN